MMWISDATALQILDRLPTLITLIAAAAGAVAAAIVSVVNLFRNSANHAAQEAHLGLQDDALKVIKQDVNSNMTVATEKLTQATAQLEAAHAQILSLTATASKSEGIIQERDDAAKK